MIYDAICRFTNQQYDWEPKLPIVENNIIDVPPAKSPEEKLHYIFKHIYNIEIDDLEMRKMIDMDVNLRAGYFDRLRKEYHLRREFTNYKVILNEEEKWLGDLLQKFRFKIKLK